MQYEDHLRDITRAQWSTQYLTNEALVNSRLSLLQVTIFGVKVGSLVGRVCKLLHLDSFECVRRFFICSDLKAACRIIKETIVLANNNTVSKLGLEQKLALFQEVAQKVNALITYVNSKRQESEKLPPECTINVEKILAVSPKGMGPADTTSQPPAKPLPTDRPPGGPKTTTTPATPADTHSVVSAASTTTTAAAAKPAPNDVSGPNSAATEEPAKKPTRRRKPAPDVKPDAVRVTRARTRKS